MTVKDWLLGVPGPSRQAQVGLPNLNRTAAGATQTTATQVTTDFEVYSTVALGTGAILPNFLSVADQGWVFNHGANALLVYPPVGGKISTLAINVGFSVPAGKGFFWVCLDTINFGGSVSA